MFPFDREPRAYMTATSYSHNGKEGVLTWSMPDHPFATPIHRGSTFQTTDPGRALVTGKCADVGKTKGPILRGLAARAPYFHNGSAATFEDVVNFYDQRFGIGFTDQEKSDLVAFLQTL